MSDSIQPLSIVEDSSSRRLCSVHIHLQWPQLIIFPWSVKHVEGRLRPQFNAPRFSYWSTPVVLKSDWPKTSGRRICCNENDPPGSSYFFALVLRWYLRPIHLEVHTSVCQGYVAFVRMWHALSYCRLNTNTRHRGLFRYACFKQAGLSCQPRMLFMQ